MNKILRPVFKAKLRIVRTLSWFVLPYPFLLFLVLGEPNPLHKHLLYVSLISLGFILIGVIWYLISKQVYKASSFEITEKGVAERENLLGNYYKELRYKDIKEIAIGQGPIQQKYGLSDIFIRSYASSPGGNSNTGLTLFDIPNAQEIYDKIREKMDNS